MQHHGLPTRLLDWTESALAGLYFAVNSHLDRDGVLYVLAPLELNGHQTGKPMLFAPRTAEIHPKLMACFQGTEKTEDIVAILAHQSNERMRSQCGHFTIHGTPKDLREVARPDYLKSIPIPAKAKPVIRKQLEYFGVRRSTLFCDLDSLAIDLREQHGLG
jgi:hypothetical protein